MHQLLFRLSDEKQLGRDSYGDQIELCIVGRHENAQESDHVFVN